MHTPNPWNIDFGSEQTLDLMEQEGYVFPHPLQSWVMPVLILEFAPGGGLCGARAMGTCFSIGPHIVVTATHVLGDLREIATMEERRVKVGVAFVDRGDDGAVRQVLLMVEQVVVNPDHDVAVLRLRPPEDGKPEIRYRSLPLSFEVPSVGTSVIALGYSESSSVVVADNTVNLAHRVRASRGRIEQLHVPRRDITLNFPAFAGDYPSPAGMSGGPVITAAGAVAAIVCRAMDPGLDDDRWTSTAALIPFLLSMRVDAVLDGVLTPELIFDLIERGVIPSDGSHRSFEFVELPDGKVDYRWRHSRS